MNRPIARVDSAELVDEDHMALRHRLRVAQEVFHRPTAAPAELWRELRALEVEAEDHFLHEEQGGFFASIVESAPELGPQIAGLQREHDRFRAALAALREACCDTALDSRQLAEMTKVLDEFERDLGAHEHAEFRLVQEVVNRDLGAGD